MDILREVVGYVVVDRHKVTADVLKVLGPHPSL